MISLTAAKDITINQQIDSLGNVELKTTDTGRLSLNSRVVAQKSITVEAHTIVQSDVGQILQSPRGIVSITTRTNESLGELTKPLTIKAQEIKINTQSSAVVHNLKISDVVSLARSTVRGTLFLSVDDTLISGSTSSDILLVQDVATIRAQKIGVGGEFRVQGLNSGDQFSLSLHSTKGSAYVTVPDLSVTILDSESAGDITVNAIGSIVLTGALTATGGFARLQSSDVITLSQGSSVIAQGNIEIRAGTKLGVALVDSSSLPQDPAITIGGRGTVMGPAGWQQVTRINNNHIEATPRSNTITINPQDRTINLNGAVIRSTGKIKAAVEESDNTFRPVSFASVVVGAQQIAITQSDIEFGTLFAEGFPTMFQSQQGLDLLEGHLVFNARKNSTISLGSVRLKVFRNTVLKVERRGANISIMNLHDTRANSVVAINGKVAINIPVGHQVILGGQITHIPSRREQALDCSFPPKSVIREISVPYLMAREQLLHSTISSDHNLREKLLHTAACLQVVKGKQEAFK